MVKSATLLQSHDTGHMLIVFFTRYPVQANSTDDQHLITLIYSFYHGDREKRNHWQFLSHYKYNCDSYIIAS